MSSSLFMTRNQEQGLLDIGKHCFKCQKLDFLPFTCDFCKHIYCEDHRDQISHQCTVERPQIKSASAQWGSKASGQDSREPVASLFPDRDRDREIIEAKLKEAKVKPTNILEKSSGSKRNGAFSKIARFFKERRERFDKTTKITNGNGVKNMMELKKLAKGDDKIVVGDRIYLWCKLVDGVENPTGKQAVFVSKKWPIGRALDSIADTMKIKNVNNSSSDPSLKLHIFLQVNGEPVRMETGERCSRFKPGDTVYIVRGD